MGGNEASILTYNFDIIAEIMTSISLLMGVGFTLGGLFQLKKHAEQRSMMASHSIAGPVMMFVCGAILCILPKFVGVALLAFWGTSNPLVYQGSPAGYSALIPPILIFVRIIGIGSFIRGVVLLSKAGGQGRGLERRTVPQRPVGGGDDHRGVARARHEPADRRQHPGPLRAGAE